jgi:hypothetical protein
MTTKQLLIQTIDQIPEEHLTTILHLVRTYLPESQTPNKLNAFLTFVDTVSFELPADYQFDRDELYDR